MLSECRTTTTTTYTHTHYSEESIYCVRKLRSNSSMIDRHNGHSLTCDVIEHNHSWQTMKAVRTVMLHQQ